LLLSFLSHIYLLSHLFYATFNLFPPHHLVSHPTTQSRNITNITSSGAGNYYSPTTLSLTGIFSSSNPRAPPPPDSSAPVPPKEKLSDSSAPVPRSHAYQGRGGAGNYMYQDTDEVVGSRQEKEKEELESTVRRRVEEDVELGLLRPVKAHLVGRESGVLAQQEDQEEMKSRAMVEERIALKEIALR